MGERVWCTSLAVLVACAALLDPGAMPAAPVAVRHTEGLVHGFLVLRTLAGDTLADGDLIQVTRGDRVTSRLVFHFKDGSVHDETTVFSQRRNFRLLSDHLVQKGAAFQHPIEVSIDGSTGQVTVRSTDDDGKEKVATDRLDLGQRHGSHAIEEHPLRCTADEGVDGGCHAKAAAGEAGDHSPRRGAVFGRWRRSQSHPLRREGGDWGCGRVGCAAAGEAPPDIHVWILGGEAPAFVKSEGPLYFGGPIWRIELVSPVWPRAPAADSKN